MKYFFPDSQDLVDPSFDFDTEERAEDRVRQRDDVYAHQLFSQPPYDGVLLSKAIVDGHGGRLGRYTIAQRHRLLRIGVREFFRIRNGNSHLAIMGDCGAFSYVREKVPPFSVDEVLEFYLDCGVDYGISVDHVILSFKCQFDQALPGVDCVPPDWRERQEITFELASEFWTRHAADGLPFTPVGVAQGWSPASYAHAVNTLQRIGFRYIALGGLVPLKTPEIAATVRACDAVREPETRFHLLGVTRLDEFKLFEDHGVASFDSTSALRQAFKDDKDNYHTMTRSFSAVRVPQVEANPRIKKGILAGELDQAEALRLERECLRKLKAYDAREIELSSVLETLRAYEELYDGRKSRTEEYRAVLEERPWESCPCEVCESLGVHVVIFRGAERNRRRGFHNTYVFYQRLLRELHSSEASQRRSEESRANA